MTIITGIIMFLGFVLRLKTYLLGRPLWQDECSLALNILHRGVFGFFTPLEHWQSAPPLFMSASKLITILSGLNEYSLRFLPFAAGIVSLPVFYKFSKLFLDKKWSIVLANALFAINYQMIYYSQEFKQYSTDTLAVMSALILAGKIDLNNLTRKQALCAGICAAVLPLLSLPTVFVTGAFLMGQLLKYRKNILVNAALFSVPFGSAMLLYYFLILLPSKKILLSLFTEMWSAGFLNADPLSAVDMFRINLNYYFTPNILALIGCALVFTGIYYFIKEKSKNLNQIVLFMLLLVIAASYAHLYPIKERVSLYLVPVVIVLLLKPLDFISLNRKVFSVFISAVTLIYFSKYNVSYFKKFFLPDIFARKDGRAVMQILAEKYSPGDRVIFNDASVSTYEVYSHYYNFYTEKFGQINLSRHDRDFYFSVLNSLPTGQNYWFYYSDDYKAKPVIPWIKQWKAGKKVLYEVEIQGSYLLELQN